MDEREKEEARERVFPYKRYMIKEGLKPGSERFQYYFAVTKEGEKKAHYCVWVDDDVLAESMEFQKGCRGVVEEQYIAAHKNEWLEWFQKKLDKEDFRDTVLKIEKSGKREIDMSEMKEKLSFE